MKQGNSGQLKAMKEDIGQNWRYKGVGQAKRNTVASIFRWTNTKNVKHLQYWSIGPGVCFSFVR